jgi:hypothetical protein
METFDPATDSVLLQKLWIDLSADQGEFENLFTANLRNLSALASWIANTVKFFYESDARGIWFAAWIAPMFTDGAEVGVWIRKDYRRFHGARERLAAIDEFYDDIVLPKVGCFIGLTRQYPALHDLHLKLGYTYVDEFPGVFDGHTVWMYKMTSESRAARAGVQAALRVKRRANYERTRRPIEEQRVEPAVEPVRADSGEVRHPSPEGGGAGPATTVGARIRSFANWRNYKSNPDRESAG